MVFQTCSASAFWPCCSSVSASARKLSCAKTKALPSGKERSRNMQRQIPENTWSLPLECPAIRLEQEYSFRRVSASTGRRFSAEKRLLRQTPHMTPTGLLLYAAQREVGNECRWQKKRGGEHPPRFRFAGS